MNAIPKSLLIHTVQLQTVTGKDAWGSEILSEPLVLQYVRLEPSTKYVKDKSNQERQLAATLFYDCRNSRPRVQSFHDGQVITFSEERYRVKLVEPLYDGRRLHHYEIGVIRDG